MLKNKGWAKTAIVVAIVVAVAMFDYQSHKSSLPLKYWYWAGGILAIGLIAKSYVDRFIAKRFSESEKARTFSEILFIALIVVPQLILFAFMYQNSL